MKRFLALLVVIAAAVAAGAFSVPSTAVSVNGQGVSEGALNSDLQAIAGSQRYQCFETALIDSQGANVSLSVHGVGENSESGENGTYSSAFVAYWLGSIVRDELTSQYLSAHNLVVSAQGLTLAKTELQTSINNEILQLAQSVQCALQEAQEDNGAGNIGTATLAELPADFVSTLVRNQADSDLMAAHVAGYSIDDASFTRYFNAHRSDFDIVCTSVVEVASQSEAQTLLGQINGGTPFAQVAKANSLDSSTAPNGGSEPCTPFVDLPPVFTSGIAGLAPGQVSQPVPVNTSGEYVLFQLNSRRPSTFSTVELPVEESMIGSGSQKFITETNQQLLAAKVSVAPKYGAWDARGEGVLEPTNPPARSVLSIGADTTTATTTPTPTIPGGTG